MQLFDAHMLPETPCQHSLGLRTYPQPRQQTLRLGVSRIWGAAGYTMDFQSRSRERMRTAGEASAERAHTECAKVHLYPCRHARAMHAMRDKKESMLTTLAIQLLGDSFAGLS